MIPSVRIFWFLAGMMFSLSGYPSALIEAATGNVRAGPTAASATLVRTSQRIQPGSTVVTGPRSQATLRFDDGQAVVLSEDSEFRVTQYSFSSTDPAKDRFVFELFKGAVRSVTGALASRNRDSYALRLPQATLGIRGTDFMVALVNPAYMSVLSGSISASNAAGAVVFGPGMTATVASATTLATAIAAAALPSAVAATFNQLGSIAIGATGTAATGAGAAGATGAAAGGLGLGALSALALGLAAVAASASSNDDSVIQPAAAPGTTTGTTGTR